MKRNAIFTIIAYEGYFDTTFVPENNIASEARRALASELQTPSWSEDGVPPLTLTLPTPKLTFKMTLYFLDLLVVRLKQRSLPTHEFLIHLSHVTSWMIELGEVRNRRQFCGCISHFAELLPRTHSSDLTTTTVSTSFSWYFRYSRGHTVISRSLCVVWDKSHCGGDTLYANLRLNSRTAIHLYYTTAYISLPLVFYSNYMSWWMRIVWVNVIAGPSVFPTDWRAGKLAQLAPKRKTKRKKTIMVFIGLGSTLLMSETKIKRKSQGCHRKIHTSWALDSRPNNI